MNINLDDLVRNTISFLTKEGLRFVLAILGLFIAFKIINILAKKLKYVLKKKHVESSTELVVISLFKKGLKLVVFLITLGVIGVETASIAALLATLGIGVGLAIQGALSNFAGGVIVLFMRPFKIDDYVEFDLGYSGKIVDVRLFYTELLTFDNKVILVPNGKVSSSVIINYSTKHLRRVDLAFVISYNNSFLKAKNIIHQSIRENKLILSEPKPFINVNAHLESGIEIIVKVWCHTKDYYDIYYDLLESIKLSFDKEGIVIPYRQIDVHISK